MGLVAGPVPAYAHAVYPHLPFPHAPHVQSQRVVPRGSAEQSLEQEGTNDDDDEGEREIEIDKGEMGPVPCTM